MAIYQNNSDFFQRNELKNFSYSSFLTQELEIVIQENFIDLSWLKSRHPFIQAYICCSKLGAFFYDGKISSEIDFLSLCDIFILVNLRCH